MTSDLEQLGRAIRDRRYALGMTQREAASIAQVADQTWANAEKGVAVRPAKLADIERVLGWAPGSANAVAEGGEPSLVQGTRPTVLPGRTIEERLSAIEAQVSPVPPPPGSTLEERVARLERTLGVDRNGAVNGR